MINTIICSRSDKPCKALDQLKTYFIINNIAYHISIDASSIFSGYQEGINVLNPKDNDIIVLCHDDIEIISDGTEFIRILEDTLRSPSVGFIGPAGTTFLDKDAIWWEINRRQKGFHSGFVFQGTSRDTMTPNYFGPWRNVVVLDGCFIACKYSLLKQIGLNKPKHFPGNWDFYDLYYTLTAYELGYTNKAVPIIIMHYSDGQLVGRESWHLNRQAFIKSFRLPVRCR